MTDISSPDDGEGQDFFVTHQKPSDEEICFEELEARMDGVMRLHNSGCDWFERSNGKKFVKITEDDVSDIVEALAIKIAEYNQTFKIYPKELDTTKIVTFSAPLLMESVPGYSAVPLFYKYFHFLDSSYLGTGINLVDFGGSMFFAENLNTLLKVEKQWLAPFCFFRAIDLSFDRCALPRIVSLMEEVGKINGNSL